MATQPSAVDRALIRLIRLVVDDDWDSRVASANLRRRFDEPVLRQVRARIARGTTKVQRTGRIGERAMITITLALGEERAPHSESA